MAYEMKNNIKDKQKKGTERKTTKSNCFKVHRAKYWFLPFS